MSIFFYLFLFTAGASVGFLSGLLGIGGGILMFPLLLYAPPALGFEEIGIKNITGLTMTQGFFASLSAMLFYHSHRLVHKPLVLALGCSLFFSSLIGSLVSKQVPDAPLLIVFGCMAFIASFLMFLPRSYAVDNFTEEKISFNRPMAIIIGIILGFFLGMVGQGGAFILIPVLLYILKVPLRIAFGSMLAIGLFSSSAGLAGKIITGQVPLLMSVALLMGAIPAAQFGGVIGKRTDNRLLKWILAAVISVSAAKIWIDIL